MKYTPEENPIIIRCQARDVLPLDALTGLQRGLKKLSKENREKLVGSICEKGFIAPIFIWKHEGENKLLDGHQRTATLNFMKQKGWSVPPLPVAYVEADDEKDAREKLLLITSQYGEFTFEGFEEFAEGFNLNTENVHLADGTFALPEYAEENETVGDDLAPDIEENPASRLGETYELGRHRLLCGDSTDPAQVAALMDGELDRDNKFQCLVCRNHTKIALLEISNIKLIITGSSNLRSSRCIEQFTIQESQELFVFYKQFFDEHAETAIINKGAKQ